MKPEETKVDRSDAAIRELLFLAQREHEKGYNCSETVLWALGRYWDLNIPICVATGFGGGIARSGATCGAVSGAIMALGCKVGRSEPGDDTGKLLAYKLGQQLIAGFTREMGTVACKDILGFVLGEPDGSTKYTAGGFKVGQCKDAVAKAVRLAIEIWEETKAQG